VGISRTLAAVVAKDKYTREEWKRQVFASYLDSRTGLVDRSKQAVLSNANQRSSQKKKKSAGQSRYNEMQMICALRLSSLEE
jgi:hypothetical protein